MQQQHMQQHVASGTITVDIIRAAINAVTAVVTRCSHMAIEHLRVIEPMWRAVPGGVFPSRKTVPKQLQIVWKECHQFCMGKLAGAPLAAILDESTSSWTTLEDRPRLIAIILQNLLTNEAVCADVVPATSANANTVREAIVQCFQKNNFSPHQLFAIVSDNAAYIWSNENI